MTYINNLPVGTVCVLWRDNGNDTEAGKFDGMRVVTQSPAPYALTLQSTGEKLPFHVSRDHLIAPDDKPTIGSPYVARESTNNVHELIEHNRVWLEREQRFQYGGIRHATFVTLEEEKRIDAEDGRKRQLSSDLRYYSGDIGDRMLRNTVMKNITRWEVTRQQWVNYTDQYNLEHDEKLTTFEYRVMAAERDLEREITRTVYGKHVQTAVKATAERKEQTFHEIFAHNSAKVVMQWVKDCTRYLDNKTVKDTLKQLPTDTRVRLSLSANGAILKVDYGSGTARIALNAAQTKKDIERNINNYGRKPEGTFTKALHAE